MSSDKERHINNIHSNECDNYNSFSNCSYAPPLYKYWIQSYHGEYDLDVNADIFEIQVNTFLERSL